MDIGMQVLYGGGMNPKLILWGQQIADVRRRLGLSQAAFAKTLGSSQGTLSSWEAGRHGPSFSFMKRITDLDPQGRSIYELFPENPIDIPIASS